MAVASARAELAGSSAAAGMLHVERAAIEQAAEDKLAEIRQSLSLPAPPQADATEGGN
jgi:hypothetical protein